MLASTHTLLPLRRGNIKPNEKLPKLQPMLSEYTQIGTVNSDSIFIPPEGGGRRTEHDLESVGHPKSDASMMCQSDSSSMRNESIPSSTRTRRRGRITHGNTKQFIALRNFVDKVGLDRVPLIEKALDFASMSEGDMETSDGGKLWRLSAMQTPFVCVSSL
jgi:hypothetical protein